MTAVPDKTVKTVKKPRLLVVDLTTRKPIHAIKLTQTDEAHIAKAIAGLLRNMNTDRYCVEEDL